MKKVDYNIEYAHISTDQPRFSLEQKKSIRITKEIIKKFKKQKKTYTLTVLVDDYLPSYSCLDIGHFLLKLRENGLFPDYIAYEHRLTSTAELILEMIPKEKKAIRKIEKEVSHSKDVIFFIPPHKKFDEIGLTETYFLNYEARYDTSILMVAWYLFRLGVIDIPDVFRRTASIKSKPFVGKKILNILPEKHKREKEKQVKDLLKATNFSSKIKNIEYKFF